VQTLIGSAPRWTSTAAALVEMAGGLLAAGL
jgi:hypothetical protein